MSEPATKEAEELKCGVFSDYGQDVLAKELKAFKELLYAHDIEFFLIGGCCLGLIRNQAFLEHDKDIDIGIFEDVDLEKLMEVLRTKYINVSVDGVMNGKYVWANKEINGTLLVFEIQVHYRQDGKVFMNRNLGKSTPTRFREGRIEWDEIYFSELLLASFPDGEAYYIPSFTKEYLTVQHGDWRTPVEYPDWRYHCRNIIEGWR